MNQNITLPAVGRPFTRFFELAQLALVVLMLTAVSGVAPAQDEAALEIDSLTNPQINLNTADAEALQYIPGIGPSRAADIIRLREEKGGFNAVEELLQVPGIGEKTLLDIAKFGSVDSGVSILTEEMAANPPRMEASADPETGHADEAAAGG